MKTLESALELFGLCACSLRENEKCCMMKWVNKQLDESVDVPSHYGCSTIHSTLEVTSHHNLGPSFCFFFPFSLFLTSRLFPLLVFLPVLFIICCRIYDFFFRTPTTTISNCRWAKQPSLDFCVYPDLHFFSTLCDAVSGQFSFTTTDSSQSPQVSFYFITKCFATASFSPCSPPLLIQGGSMDMAVHPLDLVLQQLYCNTPPAPTSPRASRAVSGGKGKTTERAKGTKGMTPRTNNSLSAH